MKRIFYLIITAIILVICPTCRAQKEKLELNLVKGEVYTQKLVSDITINQKLNGQELATYMTIGCKMSYTVIDIIDSVYSLEVKYENLTMKMGLPNGSVMEFDSGSNNKQDIFSAILSVLTGRPFILKITRAGKINEVKNIDLIFSDMFEKFPQLTDIQKQQIKAQMMQAYGEKSLKGNLEMGLAFFPDCPVSVDQKWMVNTKLESGISAKMETTYQLKEIGESYHIIHGDSKIETERVDSVGSDEIPMEYDMKGTMTSEIKLNKKTGWVQEAKMSQTFKGTAYIHDNPDVPGGMAIPMTMKNEMTITEK